MWAACPKFVLNFTLHPICVYVVCPDILSRVGITIDWIGIGNWIFLTLTDPRIQVIIAVSLIHTLYSSLEHTHLKSSQSAVFTSLLVMASNGGRSPFSGLSKFPQPQLPASQSNSSQRRYCNSPLTNSPTRKLSADELITCPSYDVSVRRASRKRSSSIAFQLLPRKHCCLRIHYLVTGAISLLILRSLPSNVIYVPQYLFSLSQTSTLICKYLRI
jgi:hypothetical protein